MRNRFAERGKQVVSALAILAVIGTASAFAAPAAPTSDVPEAPESASQAATQTAPRVDPRWLPWVGCWEMFADTINSQTVEQVGTLNVCIIPRSDAPGVRVVTYLDGRAVFEESVVADGSRRRHVEDDCDGRQTAHWSADGYRLFTNSEMTCNDGLSQVTAGVSLLVSGNTWLDVESIFLDDRKHRELVVQRYRRVNDSKARELGAVALSDRQLLLAARERAAAATPLDIEDLLEAKEHVPVEAVEALVVESQANFPIDSNALNALADSGLPTSVIDLLVAQSYPDYFVVENTAVGGVAPRPVGPRVVYQPPFYTSVYMGAPGFSPWGWGWGCGGWGWGCGSWGYNSYYSPFGWSPWRGGYRGHYPSYRYRSAVPRYGSVYGGRVINNQGYARARPVATPYGGSGGRGSGSSRTAVRRGGGSSGSGGGGTSNNSGVSSSGARPSGSSVSSKGFSSGSSSGAARATAKPKGGGGRPKGTSKPGGSTTP
jgi:hypothetical protein